MEQKQNPYEFHLSEEEQVGYETNTQNAFYQSVSKENYNTGSSTDYSAYTQTGSLLSASDMTIRKKRCLVISLAVMSIGLLISFLTALITLPIVNLAFRSGHIGFVTVTFVVSIILTFVASTTTSRFIAKQKLGPGVASYIVFCILNGTMFMSIFSLYSPASILGIFLFTTIIFGGTALVALIIPKDLSGWSSSLIMGLFALLILSLVNLIFPGAEMLNLYICLFGIVLFIGLTAFDIQKIRKMAVEDSAMSVWIVGLYGGMNLYLDFLNLLLKILRLFGKRKN